MGGEVGLDEALELLNGSISDKKKGLEDLTRILRINQRNANATSLADETYQTIYQALFNLVQTDRSIWLGAKNQTTQSTSAERLSNLAIAVRLAVELGIRALSKDTVSSIITHVLDSISSPKGGLCTPLALEYTRCLRVVASRQRHVEHLTAAEWDAVVQFCIDALEDRDEDSSVDNAKPGTQRHSSQVPTNGLSYRSSRSGMGARSQLKESPASQELRTAKKHISDELIATLALLSAASNAPLYLQAQNMLTAMVAFLKGNPVSRLGHHDGFVTINHILYWAITDKIDLVKVNTTQLLRLVQHFWSTRAGSLRDEMLATLIHLRPYINQLASDGSAPTLRNELAGLIEVLRSDYIKRDYKDRLRIDQLRLSLDSSRAADTTSLSNRYCALQSNGASAEHGWAIVSILATLTGLFEPNLANKGPFDKAVALTGKDEDDNKYDAARPRKRQRLGDGAEGFLSSINDGSLVSKVCSLQVLTFIGQQQAVSESLMLKLLEHMIEACNDSSAEVVSWVYLALGSLALNVCAARAHFQSRWISIWTLASRSLMDTDTCREASHLLVALLQRQLVPQSTVSELIQAVAASIDTTGPCVVADSSLHCMVSFLEGSQYLSPVLFSTLAGSTLSWLSRHYLPSMFDDKVKAAMHTRLRPSDVACLINTCLGHTSAALVNNELPCWSKIGKVWTMCRDQEELVAYLLLDTRSRGDWLAGFSKPGNAAQINPQQSQIEIESSFLAQYVLDIQRTKDTWLEWRKDRARSIGIDRLVFLHQSLCILIVMTFDGVFQDERKQKQLQKSLEDLLKSVMDFASGPDCTQEMFNGVLTSAACHLNGLAFSPDKSSPVQTSMAEYILSKYLSDAVQKRRRTVDSHGEAEDLMDIGDDFESQQSRSVGSRAVLELELLTDADATCGAIAVNANVSGYAFAAAQQTHLNQMETYQSKDVEGAIVEYFASLSVTELVASRSTFTALEHLNFSFEPKDAYALINDLAERILESTEFDRSEPAFGTILTIMSGLLPLLTQTAHKDLYDLGIDVYTYFVEAMNKGTLSDEVQRRFGAYLLRLCDIDADYGKDDGPQSARTTLFRLVQKAGIKVQFYLANNISKIFRHFVLSAHDRIFDDLQSNLPVETGETGCSEGLALRLLYLSRLGASWHTLLRPCVYYICETAGLVKAAARYAAECIVKLKTALNFDSEQRLFRLFAAQLLYTWLDTEQHTLNSLPYAVFRYASLGDLMTDNEAEIVAQLIMRGKEDGLHVMSKVLKAPLKQLASQSFAKTAAYTIAWDCSNPSQGTDKLATSEIRLRGLVGGKVEEFNLMKKQLPIIVGMFYSSMQQEDVEDQWLEKRGGKYSAAATALARMKSHSYSARVLPRSQQPSFRSKFLPDQIERLCRRTGDDPHDLWDASSFALTARMLVDTIDQALGPLHTSLVLRKLRILISMAGKVACSGYPLQMLLHSIRPFLSESHCADDALGILKYLLQEGQSYLKSVDPSSMYGFITVVVLQMRAHSGIRQDSTTQETQHLKTVKKMELFQEWLVQYLRASSKTSNDHAEHDLYVSTMKIVHLPGSARKETAESALLLLLLRQLDLAAPLMERSRAIEALIMLTANFETPRLAQDDCLVQGHACAQYVNSLWLFLSLHKPDTAFMSWAGNVLGRAYAYSGTRTARKTTAESSSIEDNTEQNPTALSRGTIVGRLAEILVAADRAEAGLADWTLRMISYSLPTNSKEKRSFENMLPASLVAAIQGGPHDYVHPVAASIRSQHSGHKELREALKVCLSVTNSAWSLNLAETLCFQASHIPLLSSLPALFRSVEGLAKELLGSIVHLMLADEIDKNQALRTGISNALMAHFALEDEASRPRQRLLIELILYLRRQPWPGEMTQADRMQWLEFDLLTAAGAAVRCGLPYAALLFAESMPPVSDTSRGGSSRASMSQLHPASVPNDLLLTVFKQIEEPDSFYGVQQEASLDTIIERLDYEANGLGGLMYRSARMDSAMRRTHDRASSEAIGMMRSLSAMDLYSLEFTLLSSSSTSANGSSDEMLDAARRLQQWDMPTPRETQTSAAVRFSAFQELSRATDIGIISDRLTTLMSGHMRHQVTATINPPSAAWYYALTSLSGISDIVRSSSEQVLLASCALDSNDAHHLQSDQTESITELTNDRATICSVLNENLNLLRHMHVSPKAMKTLEARTLLNMAELARKNSNLQEALSATTQLSLIAQAHREGGLNISAAAKMETSAVLWETGELEGSVSMLKDILAAGGSEGQDLPIGESGVLATIANRLAEARLERPDDILQNHLKPAIKHLKGRVKGKEAGDVFHAFATFCDRQLQHPSNVEEFNRVSRMRLKKEKELDDLEAIAQVPRKSCKEQKDAKKALRDAQSWLELDTEEYHKLKESRDTYMQLSLQNYLLALHASDEHDICLLRFFALWLENWDSAKANGIVVKHLGAVSSWKFVVLINQLMSRLDSEQSLFQSTLSELVARIGADHPHHAAHHLFAATRNPVRKDDFAARSRQAAAMKVRNHVERNTPAGPVITRIFSADRDCMKLAYASVGGINQAKIAVKDFAPVAQFGRAIKTSNAPPTIVRVPLRPDCKYDGVPQITDVSTHMGISSGLSKPKSLGLRASDGKWYKQLFKYSEQDDMRQDAIMEQVFEEASKMLRNHKATRQRDLQVRAYKVIPLDTHSAVVEWVLNTRPIGDYLKPAHQNYHTKSMRSDEAFKIIRGCEKLTEDVRVREFRKVCASIQPVLRHFFFELYDDPSEWFAKRTAYTRTTAAISILGWVLGLGDRHCQNILLDQQTGEAVHIDLGVAFEAGRVLPIPEKVPFRLSRDIVDGMGVTKTEGVFRRCCEFTLEALREDKASIMTLLNVLRYDPLVNWTVSPLRAKRMQQAMSKDGVNEDGSSTSAAHEGGEAERALGVVEKKLSKSLSTSATVNELILQATDEKNLATLFAGWSAYF
ncbi:hypothetical protein LTR62_000181 [Meristemomyces frigidus]|uniref:Serine/threonine-protein kinase Tel1 n=1 Tax=Meristemomyces frigidus TaxID=1508187 RepID=A0AAN7TK57_9PEZI|nr:hypothetical protein LTR62_000181 [Meristemomyces frigidus]